MRGQSVGFIQHYHHFLSWGDLARYRLTKNNKYLREVIMKISELLHQVADHIASTNDQEYDIGVDQSKSNEDITDEAMVPPLQAEWELRKQQAGMPNAFSNQAIGENMDHIQLLKKYAGLK